VSTDGIPEAIRRSMRIGAEREFGELLDKIDRGDPISS